MDTDFLLIRKMRQGDEEAIDLFVRKYYPDIFRYCRYHCFDTEYAEDLTQETFVRFFEKFAEYHHFGKAKNYLYTIAGNLCKDYYKKRLSFQSKNCRNQKNIRRNRCRINLWSNGRCISSPVNSERLWCCIIFRK